MAALAAERYLSEKGLLKEMPPPDGAVAPPGPVAAAEASRPKPVTPAPAPRVEASFGSE